MDNEHDEYSEYSLYAGIFQCLTLHCKIEPYILDGEPGQKDLIPNSLAMRLNYRSVDLTRFGIGVEQNDLNLFDRARNEKDNDFPSFLYGHPLTLVFTSFEIGSCVTNHCVNDSTRMKSALFDDDDFYDDDVYNINDVENHIHAVPLSLDIINGAICWLHGKTTQADSVEEAETVEGGLFTYFQLLQEKIPLQKPPGDDELKAVLKSALDFIDSHTWSCFYRGDVDELTKKARFYVQNPNEVTKDDFWSCCCVLRKCFLSRVAEHTKVVGHIVDGIHRLTALEHALVTPSAKKSCLLKLKTKVYVPAELSCAFVERMNILSNQTQNQQGRLKDHGRREFYSHLINLLDETCQRNNIGDKYMIHPRMGCKNSTLPADMETFSNYILDVLVSESSCQFSEKVPEMKLRVLKDNVEEGDGNRDKVICSLFQNKHREWSLHWHQGENTMLRSITRFKNGLYYQGRYEKGPLITSTLFELAQVLMWTRISKESHTQLSNFFSKNLPYLNDQLTVGDDLLTLKWVGCMVNTITTCVYFSHKVYGYLKIKPKGEEAPVLPTLITCAIQLTLPFFSQYGINPKPPEWFNSIESTLNNPDLLREIFERYQTENGDTKEVDFSSCKSLPTDFNTFVTVAFALHLHSGIFKRVVERRGGKPVMRVIKETMNDITDLFQQKFFTSTTDTDGETKRWTLDINLYVKELDKNQDDIQMKALTSIVYYLLPRVQTGKKTSTNSTAIVINQHSDEQYRSLQVLMQKFKTTSFDEYLQSIINDTSVSNKTKSMAKDLSSKKNAFNVNLLEKCYREEVDIDGR